MPTLGCQATSIENVSKIVAKFRNYLVDSLDTIQQILSGRQSRYNLNSLAKVVLCKVHHKAFDKSPDRSQLWGKQASKTSINTLITSARRYFKTLLGFRIERSENQFNQEICHRRSDNLSEIRFKTVFLNSLNFIFRLVWAEHFFLASNFEVQSVSL